MDGLVDYSALTGAPELPDRIVKGRNPREGYARGWGLQFGGLTEKIRADPVYRDAMRLAERRTIQAEACRMNLYLITRFQLHKLEAGDIIEFGSYMGGCAIFLAAVAKATGLKAHVWALDTYAGMPQTDMTIDLHRKGDFPGVDVNELRMYAADVGLDNITFVQGLFEDTTEGVLRQAKPIVLAHIDCDIKSAVAYTYTAVKPRMAPGGYIAFDDAHYSSCLGATEAVEDLVIRQDGKNCEQIYPHFVFREWR